MASKQGKDRKVGSSAGVRNTGQGNMDTGIAPPTNASGAKSAAQSANNSGNGATKGAKQAPGTALGPGGHSPQSAAASQATTAGAAMAGNAAAGEAPKSPPLDKVQALGHALWLMTQSPVHRHMFVADMEWLLIAPVSLGQFRLWRQGNQPVGFVTWAFVNDEVDERLRKGDVKLRPQDWNSGEKAWLIDMLLPFGGTDQVLKELKSQVFPRRELTYLRFNEHRQLSVHEI